MSFREPGWDSILSKKSFPELAAMVADGNIVDAQLFLAFLKKGTAFWSYKVASNPTDTFAAQLAEKFSTALFGTAEERHKFCLEEANYFLQKAAVLKQLGYNPEEVNRHTEIGKNWQSLPNNTRSRE